MQDEQSDDLERALRRRLGFASYLLRLAREQARRPVPFRYAALLTAHDAVELFLVLACERYDAGRQSMDFLQYFEALKQKEGITLSQRKALGRLNKARVALKHHGTWPSDHDLDVFLTTADLFFEDNCPTVFGIEASSVSLADFVRNSRAKTELRQAEALLSTGDLVSAVRAAAIGLECCLDDFDRRGHRFGGALRPGSSTSTIPSGDLATDRLERALKALERRVDRLQAGVAQLAADIDPAALARFRKLAPGVMIMASGEPTASYRTGQDEVSKEDAEFCVQFAVETCIQVERRIPV